MCRQHIDGASVLITEFRRVCNSRRITCRKCHELSLDRKCSKFTHRACCVGHKLGIINLECDSTRATAAGIDGASVLKTEFKRVQFPPQDVEHRDERLDRTLRATTRK